MEYLAHHGIKGQKWGIRRYQNEDGSLTDEGRRRYGYGIRQAGRLMTQNTKGRMKSGAKLGSRIGVAVGSLSGLATTSIAIAMLPGSVPFSIGAAYIASSALAGTVKGALTGAGIGGIVGAVETKKGRNFIERYDKGLKDFEKREEVAFQKEKQNSNARNESNDDTSGFSMAVANAKKGFSKENMEKGLKISEYSMKTLGYTDEQIADRLRKPKSTLESFSRDKGYAKVKGEDSYVNVEKGRDHAAYVMNTLGYTDKQIMDTLGIPKSKLKEEIARGSKKAV